MGPELVENGCAVAEAGPRLRHHQSHEERVPGKLLHGPRFQHGDFELDARPDSRSLRILCRREDAERPRAQLEFNQCLERASVRPLGSVSGGATIEAFTVTTFTPCSGADRPCANVWAGASDSSTATAAVNLTPMVLPADPLAASWPLRRSLLLR